MNATDTVRIYVASLSDYNNGVLHGVWIDATQEADGIHEEVQAMLLGSKHPNVQVECPDCDGMADEDCKRCEGTGEVASAEEWAIHDYEGFHGVKIEESEDFETVSEIAQAIEEHGEAFAAFMQYDDFDVERFQEAYCGKYDTEQDYAEELFDEIYLPEVPESVRYYIDYEKFSRDLFISDYYSIDAEDGGVFIFNRNV